MKFIKTGLDFYAIFITRYMHKSVTSIMTREILNYSIINSLDFLSREGLMIHCIDSLKLN